MDERRLTERIARARALRTQGRASEAAAAALAAVEAAEDTGGGLLVDALEEHAHHAGADAAVVLGRAARIAAEIDDRPRLRRVSVRLAERRLDAGQVRGVEVLLARVPGGEADAAWCCAMGRAVLARDAGDEAVGWLERARALGGGATATVWLAEAARRARGEAEPLLHTALEEARDGPERALAWRALAGCARDRGDLGAAEAALVRAAAEDGDRLDLALARIELGRIEQARADLEGLSDPVAAAALAVCAAHTGDTEVYDAAFRRPPAELGSRARDVARLARLAGTRAATRSGWLTRAVRAHRVALAVWDRLDEPREADLEVEALVRLRAEGARPQLGPFALSLPMASGAFGEVWRARHETGVEVAIKVLLPDAAGSRASLERELRAVATLDHPHIVRLLDHGTVDRAAAAMVPGLLAGSPWIATELAEGGTLEPHLGRWPWDSVRRVLLAVLEALGHAHARGLLHLDVKPANVLLSGEVPKLVDFGLATAIGSGVARVAGTPAYMAPEQFRGREVGPWTDLYAVGCLAVAMVQGAPPFDGETVEDTRTAHFEAQPKVAPCVDVPEAFLPWVRRLLVKHPPERFRRAADAARALEDLAGPTRLASDARHTAQEHTATTIVLPLPADGGPPLLDVLGARIEVPAPAVPADWRRAQAPPPPALADAGLGLFAVRRFPFVGRVPERDALWEALRSVSEQGVASAVVVVAEAGLGASSLAAWLCERAHESGAASVLAASGDVADAQRGLARHLGCARLEVTEQVELLLRLHPGVRRTEAEILAEVLSGRAGLSRRERKTVLVRAVGREARRRPLVLWADRPDADLADLLEAIVALREPILVVITTRPGLPALGAPHRRLVLGALSHDEHRELLATLLPLTSDAARRIGSATTGQPRFAVQLLTDLAAADQLQATADGWALRPGAELPASLEALWRNRLRDVLTQLPPDAADALRIAALLEPYVDDRVWATACEAAGVRYAPEARDALLDARLAHPHDLGWDFEDTALRYAALGPDDPAPLHEACAGALAMAGGDPAEIGRHWLAAGQLQAGVTELIRAAASAIREGRTEHALGLCDRVEVAALGLEGEAKLRAEVEAELCRADAAHRSRAHEEAEQRLERVRALATEAGLVAIANQCAIKRATSIRVRGGGPVDEAELEAIAQTGPLRARALLELGRRDENARRFERARERYEAALEIAADEDVDAIRTARASLGNLLRRVGRAAEGLPLLTSGRDAEREAGARFNEALLTVDLAASLRAAGHTLQAEAELEHAERLFEAMGSWAATFAAGRRALLLWASGRWDEGDRVARRLVGASTLEAVVRLVEAAPHVDRDWNRRVDEAMAARSQHKQELVEALALAEHRARDADLRARAAGLVALRAQCS